MNQTSENIEEYITLEDEANQQFGPHTVSFLEYESGGQEEKECGINNHSYNIFTKNWSQKKEEKAKSNAKDKEVDDIPKQILLRKQSKEDPGPSNKIEPSVDHDESSLEDSFDSIEHCKWTKVQISQFEYLKKNLQQLYKLVHCIKKDLKKLVFKIHQEPSDLSDPNEQKESILKEPSLIATTFFGKPDPFYISLHIAGCKLSNSIIYLGAFDNVMPS